MQSVLARLGPNRAPVVCREWPSPLTDTRIHNGGSLSPKEPDTWRARPSALDGIQFLDVHPPAERRVKSRPIDRPLGLPG